MEEQRLDIVCVFTANRKKLDKYIKVNKIKNKIIIDIQKIVSSEKFDLSDPIQAKYLKILILKKINTAKQKGKTVFYVPYIKSERFSIKSLISLSKLTKDNGTFGLLYFWRDFSDKSSVKAQVLEHLDEFGVIQMFEDY